jgi:hypothetical protein
MAAYGCWGMPVCAEVLQAAGCCHKQLAVLPRRPGKRTVCCSRCTASIISHHRSIQRPHSLVPKVSASTARSFASPFSLGLITAAWKAGGSPYRKMLSTKMRMTTVCSQQLNACTGAGGTPGHRHQHVVRQMRPVLRTSCAAWQHVLALLASGEAGRLP